MQRGAPLQQSEVGCSIRRTNIQVNGNISGKSTATELELLKGQGSNVRLYRRQKAG
jgi:hypothetical protein